MSLTIRILGTADAPLETRDVVLAPQGPDNSAFALVDLATSTEDPGSKIRYPLTVSGSREKTSKGVRRIMLKASVKIPTTNDISTGGSYPGMAITYGATSSRMREITCHAVLTIPNGIEFALEGGSGLTQVPERAVQLVVSAIASLLCNTNGPNTMASGDVLVMGNQTSPLMRGLVGTWPIDVLNGTYGRTA